MITEERQVEVIHPTAGVLIKVNRYTWDETIYPTWEEAFNSKEFNGGFECIEFVRKINS